MVVIKKGVGEDVSVGVGVGGDVREDDDHPNSNVADIFHFVRK